MEHAGGPAAEADLGADHRVVDFLGDAFGPIAVFGRALADEGVRRGLVGPREVPRLWERHLLNSAAAAGLLPETGTLVDVGSGAGLPGVVLAAMRPGMRVVLLEPMERRVVWLRHVRELTGLTNIEVVRGRAEELAGRLVADVVTARAVAPMERLAGWTLPLLREGGVLLALKGRQAQDELVSAADELARLGGDAGEVLTVGTVPGLEETTVVRVVRRQAIGTPPARSASPRGAARAGSQGGSPAGSRSGSRERGRGAR